MSDMAIIVPTRGRPANIVKVIEAWDFTQAWQHADLILAVDADDPEVDGYFELAPGRSQVKAVCWPEWMPMVHKLNATAFELAGPYRVLGFAGDDHLPRTIGWAGRYLEALGQLGTGLVYGDDGYQGAKLCTEWAMTSDIVTALGVMVPADVEHMYSDVAVLELMNAAGCARHLPEIRIEHMHPIANKAENDDQYRRVNSREQFARDLKAYQRWQSYRRQEQVEAVRALRPGRPVLPPAGRQAAGSTTNNHGRRKGRAIVKRSAPSSQRRQSQDSGRLPIPRFFRRVRGATPDEIGITLADFASGVPADQAIVELGVYQGRTALLMAWGAREGNGAHVTGIDAWELPANTYGAPFKTGDSREWAKYNVEALGYAEAITLVQGYSVEQAEQWAGPPIGLLFVDADHSYSGARDDITAWARHLAPGALVAVDDYGARDYPGVKQAVDDLVAENFLASVQLYHDRLAVTRLGDGPAAITSEGVRPEPIQVPTVEALADSGRDLAAMGAAVPAGVTLPRFEPVAAGKAETVALPEPGDAQAALFEPGNAEVDREFVTAAEALDVTGMERATTLEALNMVQLRHLAQVRGITLGVRKDKKADTLQALREGR